MIVGYARVSTKTQSADSQIKILKEYGCDIIHHETISGALKESKLENEIIPSLKEGDELVVTKFDRLGRSTKHFMRVLETMKEKKVKVKSIQENIDHESPFGSFFLMMIAHMNEWERQWISERTRNALAVVRERQGYLGRRKGSVNPQTLRNQKIAYHMKFEQGLEINEIVKFFNVSKASVFTWIWKEKKKHGK